MICRDCEQNKPIKQFPLTYNKRYPTSRHKRCKTCFRKLPSQKAHDKRKHARRRTRRYATIKTRAIEYLGSKCQGKNCPLPSNFEIPYYAYDFHHRNPSKKDFGISKFICKNHAKTSCWDELKKELDKCDLVCCLCHRIIHAEILERNST